MFMKGIHPGFAPIVIFLLVIFVLITGTFAINDWESTVIIAKWVFFLVVGGVILRVVSWLLAPFTQDETVEYSSSQENLLYPWDADLDATKSFVTPLKGGQAFIDLEGHTFLLKRDSRGFPTAQEVKILRSDTRGMNLNPIGQVYRVNHSDPRTWNGVERHLKWIVNKRKGRF
jgi:hypothetical protein